MWIALENRNARSWQFGCGLYYVLKLSLVSLNSLPELLRFIHRSCMLSFLHLQSFSYVEASCFCLLSFCLTHWHFIGVPVPAVHLPQRFLLKLSVHTLWLSQWKKLESDTRAFLSPQPGTLNQAIKDVEALVDQEVDGSVHSLWLMAEWVFGIFVLNFLKQLLDYQIYTLSFQSTHRFSSSLNLYVRDNVKQAGHYCE